MTPPSYRPWSHSRLETARTCLRRFWLRYVKDYPGYPTEAIVEGKRLHALFAQAVEENAKKKGNPTAGMTPEEKSAWEEVEPQARMGKSEVFLAVDEDGKPATEKERYFLLGHLDVVVQGVGVNVIDWKMGGGLMYDEAQAEVYAILHNAWYRKWEPTTVCFLFPFAGGDLARRTKTLFYTPEEVRELFGVKYRPMIYAMEEELGALDPEDMNQWEPNPEACGGCLYWLDCAHKTRRIICQGKNQAA